MPQRVDFVRVMVLVDLDKKGGGRVYWPVDGQAARQGRAKAEAGRGLATEQVLGRAHQSLVYTRATPNIFLPAGFQKDKYVIKDTFQPTSKIQKFWKTQHMTYWYRIEFKKIHIHQRYLYCKEGCGVGVACHPMPMPGAGGEHAPSPRHATRKTFARSK